MTEGKGRGPVMVEGEVGGCGARAESALGGGGYLAEGRRYDSAVYQI